MKVYINHKGELWGDYKFSTTEWSSPIGGIKETPTKKAAIMTYLEKGKQTDDWTGSEIDFLTVPLYGIRK